LFLFLFFIFYIFFCLRGLKMFFFFGGGGDETPCMWVGRYCKSTHVEFRKTVLVSWLSAQIGKLL